jgi:hypothetical protein
MSTFLLEGIDHLGKSSLAQNIQARLGFHQVIHLGRPVISEAYSEMGSISDMLLEYQRRCCAQMFDMVSSADEFGHNFIFDRAHLGECVYAPMYRHYSGDYVFDMELEHGLHDSSRVKLILLTEDFSRSNHFVDDGLSFDPTKRESEQQMFIEAFNKSNIKNKRIVNVTDKSTGKFRSFDEITEEVLQ